MDPCRSRLLQLLSAPKYLQALADRDAQVASLRQELAHTSSGAGEIGDEVVRLKAELQSSHQVVQGCTCGLCLLAPVLETKWLLPFKQPGSLSKAAILPSRQYCTKCAWAVNVDGVQTAWVAWQRLGFGKRWLAFIVSEWQHLIASLVIGLLWPCPTI